MPLHRRLPKKGFSNVRFRDKIAIVNVSQLNDRFEDGATVNEQALRDAGLLKGRIDAIKVLGNGDLERKLTVVADAVSGSAREKIEKAGGSVEVSA
jgi:large subunit ribosomal protein L15